MGDIDKSPYGDTFSVFDAMIASILYRNRTFSGYVLHFFAYFLKNCPFFSADEGGNSKIRREKNVSFCSVFARFVSVHRVAL